MSDKHCVDAANVKEAFALAAQECRKLAGMTRADLRFGKDNWGEGYLFALDSVAGLFDEYSSLVEISTKRSK